MRSRFAALVRPALLLPLAIVAATGARRSDSQPAAATPAPVIVRLSPTASPDASIGEWEQRLSFHSRQRFRRVAHGFSAALTPAQLSTLRTDPRVARVDPDPEVGLPERTARVTVLGKNPIPRDINRHQYVPTGIGWCGTLSSPTAHIGRSGPAPDAGVAVVDTGIDPLHPDLNVVGGTSVRGGSYTDGNGHGTHVAGIIGARDNDLGVVGIAPGCRLYAVRVLNSAGKGRLSDVMAGLDWVIAHQGEIEVVNMSLATPSSPDDGPFHDAVDACVAAGVTVVVAAGNNAADARGFVPAAYDSAITVAALASFEDHPGDSTGLHHVGGSYYQLDQAFATFSNYGPKIDLVAPGVSILSTYKKHGYAIDTGTSMAAPHVAGAAALYRVTHPSATPAQVKSALRALGSYFSPPADPDGNADPALDTSTL